MLVATAQKGRANVMAMSWHTMLEFEPPLVGCVISNRNCTFDVLKATGECTINIPTVDLAAKVVRCGNVSGLTVNKFDACGLTPAPSSCLRAPIVAECFANLECKVIDRSMVAKYNFFVLEVVKAWIDPARKSPRTIHHRGRGVFMVAGRTLKLPSRMK